jgi:hypothetical protein
MDEQALWGVLLMAYTFPFWLWQFSAHLRIENRRKVYADDAGNTTKERRFNTVSLIWCVGLVAALLAWNAEWKPIPTFIILFATLVTVPAVRAVVVRRSLLTNSFFRYWLAASAVWSMGVSGWFLVFERVSALRGDEFVLLALVPPVIGGFAITAWKWARKAT